MTRLVAEHDGSDLWSKLRRDLSEAAMGAVAGRGNLKAIPG